MYDDKLDQIAEKLTKSTRPCWSTDHIEVMDKYKLPLFSPSLMPYLLYQNAFTDRSKNTT